jgi:hypothetical protein
MLNDEHFKLVPKNSTFEQSKKESLRQTTQKTAKTKRPKKGVRRTTRRPAKTDGRTWWKDFVQHFAGAVAIGGTGTVFYKVQAPSEVTILLLIVDVIYIIHIIRILNK